VCRRLLQRSQLSCSEEVFAFGKPHAKAAIIPPKPHEITAQVLSDCPRPPRTLPHSKELKTAADLLFLVGAAGFEPTTCSTQNCRATRLRYTPNIWETTSIHA
jgi:hypothetical protein